MKFRASSATRYANCPGSAKATVGLDSPDTPAATRGTRIHALLAVRIQTGTMPQGDIDETECATLLWGYAGSIIEPCVHKWVEEPLEMGSWTGHADFMGVTSDGWLEIVDWKTGFGEIDDAPVNAQGRVYAVLGWYSKCIQKVRFHLVTPRGITTAEYVNHDALVAAKDELGGILAECRKRNAMRVIGQWCQYCAAKCSSRCPESSALIMYPDKSLSVIHKIESLPAPAIAMLMERVSIAEQICDAVKTRAKELAATGELPGWQLAKQECRRNILDVQRAVGQLTGISETEILSTCSLSVSKLEKLVAKNRNIPVQEASSAIATCLVDNLELKPSERKLQRVKAGQPRP